MQFSPTRFNAHLSGMGHDLGWRRSYACPCVNPSSGQPNPAHAACGGKGRQWDAEIVCRIGFQGQSARKGMADFGVWEPGDAVLTIGSDQACYNAGRFDRFRSLSSTHTFTDNLRRSYTDRLNGTIISVDRVFWLDANGNNVAGDIPSVDPATGALTWASGAPPAGVVYSISGTRYDEYFAYLDLPQNRPLNAGAALPKKLPVRRFDLFGR